MAYEFNGTNQYLGATRTTPSNYPFTICALVKTTATGFRSAFGWGSATDINHHVTLALSGTNKAIFNFRAGNSLLTNSSESSGTINDGNWTHIAGQAIAADSGKVFVNGVQAATSSVNVANFPSNLSLVALAALSRTSVGSYWSGQLAECALWSAELTADEIASLAKGMTCDKVRPQSLQFYAPLIRNLQDLKAGVTITNNNTATVANHPRVYA